MVQRVGFPYQLLTTSRRCCCMSVLASMDATGDARTNISNNVKGGDGTLAGHRLVEESNLAATMRKFM